MFGRSREGLKIAKTDESALAYHLKKESMVQVRRKYSI